MKKKGDLKTEPFIHLFIILAAFLLIVWFFFLSPHGLSALTKLGEKIGLSNLPIKPEVKEKEVTELPIEVEESFDSLVEAIEKGKSNPKSDCLIKYKTFPEEIKDNNIKVSEESGGGLSLTAFNKLGQVKSQKSIEGLKPCYNDNKLKIYNSNKIIINEKDKINAGKDIGYEDVTVLGGNYKLLYKGDSNNICFLTECDNNCFNDLTLNQDKVFCDGLEKERWSNVFFEKTYYGDKDDWKLDKTGWLESELWRYYKVDADKRVPGKFKEAGIMKQDFEKVFRLTFLKDVEHNDLGVWYEGKYYGEGIYGEDGWCIENKGIGHFAEDWIYQGTDPKIEKEMTTQTKLFVFGGLRNGKNIPYDYQC